jgi:hypothetical protein
MSVHREQILQKGDLVEITAGEHKGIYAYVNNNEHRSPMHEDLITPISITLDTINFYQVYVVRRDLKLHPSL